MAVLTLLCILWALSCKTWPYTQTHTWQHKLGSLSLYIKGPTTLGVTFVLWQQEKRENFMMLSSLWFYLTLFLLRGKWACCVCSTGSCHCQLVRFCLVYLTDCLSVLTDTSGHLIENAVICSSQMSECRADERGKEGSWDHLQERISGAAGNFQQTLTSSGDPRQRRVTPVHLHSSYKNIFDCETENGILVEVQGMITNL